MLMPICDKKISKMGLVYIINQRPFDCRKRGPRFKLRRPFDFFSPAFLTLIQKKIEVLTKIRAKITIIVVENGELY